MAKAKTQYVCQSCGGVSAKWQGQCPACDEWNTLEESLIEKQSENRFQGLAQAAKRQRLADIEAEQVPRMSSGLDELDRVLGGGIVPGGVCLIGGDPGIGKSTLLLQSLALIHQQGLSVLYISGEESGAQIALRAQRLGIDAPDLQVLAEIQLQKIIQAVEQTGPAVVVIDSIQTVYSEELTSAPGSVAQVVTIS